MQNIGKGEMKIEKCISNVSVYENGSNLSHKIRVCFWSPNFLKATESILMIDSPIVWFRTYHMGKCFCCRFDGSHFVWFNINIWTMTTELHIWCEKDPCHNSAGLKSYHWLLHARVVFINQKAAVVPRNTALLFEWL